MKQRKTLSIVIVLLLVLFAFLGVRPATAALPEGITPTPTEPAATEPPTATPEQPTATPEQPTATPEQPTATPTSPISPPVGGTATPTTVGPTPTTPPQEPPPRAPKPKATEVPLLPTTGEIPPDSPFGGPFMMGILAAGILIGIFIGFGSRRFLASRFGRWISLFLSSQR